MTGPGSEAGVAEAQEQFNRHVAETRSRFDRIAELQTKAGAVSVSATSPDGSVTVTVNAAGVLTDLHINDRLSGQPGARIADQVLSTMRRAQARIADKMRDVMRDTVGDDKEVVNQVLANYHDRFPEPLTPDRPDAVDEMRLDTSANDPAPTPTLAPAPTPAPAAVPRRARAPRSGAAEDEGWDHSDDPIMEEL